MKTKHPAVQSTAPCPISAYPFKELLDLLPDKAQILGAKAHRNAGKSEIRIIYLENGRLNVASCSFAKVVGENVYANVETLSCKWKGVAV